MVVLHNDILCISRHGRLEDGGAIENETVGRWL
jgi:hypothetical protein